IATEVVVAPAPFKHERPDPPPEMPELQAAIWRAAVSSMRPAWFSPETHAMLTRYCNGMAECARLEVELSRMDVASPEYDRVSRRRNVWRAVIGSRPAGHFGPEVFPVLLAYCATAMVCERVGSRLRVEDGVDHALLETYDRMTRSLMSLAEAL